MPEAPYDDYAEPGYAPADPYARGAGRQPAYPDDGEDWGGPAGRAPQRVRERSQVGMPPALSGAIGAVDPRVLAVTAGSILSVILMAAFGAVRIEALPDWFPLHFAANGIVDQYGTPSTLWRLPFGLTILTVMNLGAAILLRTRERFAAALFIGALALVHVVAWLGFVSIAFR